MQPNIASVSLKSTTVGVEYQLCPMDLSIGAKFGEFRVYRVYGARL